MGGQGNTHFNMGNMGGNGGTTQFFMNGKDMGGMGMDPNQIFSMFMNRGGGDDFGGFGGFGGMRGASKSKGTKKGQSQSRKFGGFDGFQGFGNFGNFGQEGSNFA